MNTHLIWNKILDFFGLNHDLEEEVHNDVDNNRVISIYKNKGFRIMLHQPESFAEIQNIVDELKARKPIILNLQSLDRELARRIIDFISGAVYGIGGDVQKIAEAVFIFTPHNIKIDSQLIKKSKSLFS